ncbi:MAG: GLPGLI family protein [Prevotellaceae bacterium]|nr:GLPGLI family protein [Candidatus Minthosoma equi]
MKTKLTIILAFVANMMSAQMLIPCKERLDTLCQPKLTAVYLYTIHTSDDEGKPVTDSIRLALQVGEDVWKTWAYERYENEKSHKDSIVVLPFLHNEAVMHITTTTVGYPEGKTTSIETIAPNQYEVMEDIEKPVWKKVKGKESVCGYQCRKAIGEFRGKKWNVSYAADIPTVAGPWKLHGLSGLITYATDEKGIHTFQLISVNEEAVPITCSSGYPYWSFVGEKGKVEGKFITKVYSYVKVTREKCLEMKNELFGDSQYLTNTQFYNRGTNIEHYDPNLLVVSQPNRDYKFRGGLYIPDKGHKYQPLELK